MKLLNALVALGLLGFAACTKDLPAPTSPEAALERYVKTAFSAKSVEAKEALLELSEGDAKMWLESLSDDEFKKQFVENQMQFVGLRTRDKIQDKTGDVSLVYELEFKDGRGPKPLDQSNPQVVTPSSAAYSTKKIAYLTNTDKGWKVKATKNVKTFIERKEDLAVPPLSVLPPDENEKQPAAKGK
jgi:hypothetical protein